MKKEKDENRQKALELAEIDLKIMRYLVERIAVLETEAERELARVSERYEKELSPLKARLAETDKSLLKFMRVNKKILFREDDVVTLKSGALIHSEEDKVSIPRGALDQCKAQGFIEVIKTVESLDREAVEKWPDERLLLIGAERKPVEKFSYNIKKSSVLRPAQDDKKEENNVVA